MIPQTKDIGKVVGQEWVEHHLVGGKDVGVFRGIFEVLVRALSQTYDPTLVPKVNIEIYCEASLTSSYVLCPKRMIPH